MDDFHDCLHHPVVHVVAGEFKPGQFETAQRLYAEAIATYRQGFHRAYLLREPGSDRGLSIILWNSWDDMDEQQRDAAHQRILQQMGSLFQQRPHSRVYELACQIEGPGLTSEQVEPPVLTISAP